MSSAAFPKYRRHRAIAGLRKDQGVVERVFRCDKASKLGQLKKVEEDRDNKNGRDVILEIFSCLINVEPY